VLGVGAVSAASTATTAASARSPHAGAAPTSSPIQHIVFIYRENHSFDNMFAIYCVQTHKCDGTTGMVKVSGGRTLATRPAADLVPFVCHNTSCQRTAMHGGAMDGFDLINGCFESQKYACLQQFKPTQIPTVTWMADHGVLADRFFSETNPSAGAHMFFFSGEDKQGFVGNNPAFTPPGYTAKPGWGCDSNRQGWWTNAATQVDSLQWFCNPNASWLPNGGAPGPTQVKGVPDFFTSILEPRGITWKNYGEPKPGGNWGWNVAPYHAAALAHNAGHLTQERQILNDARLGRLPNVSIVTPAQVPGRPGEDTSQHNNDSMATGDNFINDVLRSVQSGPQAGTTAVIVLYDDCGCFYDHVPPPADLGIRVPLLIWSKWAKAGTVDHKPAQFASVLAFIEHNFGLPSLTSLNPNAQDGLVTNDLMGNFTFAKTRVANAPMAGSDPLPPRQQIPAAEMTWLRQHASVSAADPDGT
jgi:phospholipase C